MKQLTVHRQDRRRLLQLACGAAPAALGLPRIALAAPSEIGLGLVGPSTGPQAGQAEAVRRGVEACVAELNRGGGIGGRLVSLVTLDNQFKPDLTVAAVKTLAGQDRMLAMTSLLGGAVIPAAVTAARDAGLPVVGVLHGGDNYRAAGTEIVTHVRASFGAEISAIARLFVTIGRRRFAVLHASDNSGLAFLNQFGQALKPHQLPVIAAVPYTRETKDFAPMAKQIGASGADVVVVGGVTGPGIGLIEAMTTQKMSTQVVCLSTVDDRVVWKTFGERAKGVAFSSVVPSPHNVLLRIIREYQAAMASKGFQELSLASVEGYLNTRVFAEAVRRAGSSPTRESLQRTLKSMSEVALGGVTFGPKGAPPNSGINVADILMLTYNGRMLR